MNKIVIIGAGQLGSRHLQALKNVQTPLDIFVVDPSAQSLKVAEERYMALENENPVKHHLSFLTELGSLDAVDVAIIATNADVRRKVAEQLLNQTTVKYLILEKLLFNRPEDYPAMLQTIRDKKTKTWVNCSMRTMPFHAGLRNHFLNKTIQYIVNGSQYGLITNAIHYIDHMLYITGCSDFTLQTDYLDTTVIPSKRKGFLELTGTLLVKLENGSLGMLTCYPSSDSPFMVEIFSDAYRCLSRETEKIAWISSSEEKWQWQEKPSDIPFQSTMTATVVNGLLAHGQCNLAPFEESVRTHLSLLNPLLQFLNTKTGNSFDYYPFT